MSWKDIVKAKELTPKQKKLDRNHNGVIDAQDFHIMGGSDEKKSCGENCPCSKCTEKMEMEKLAFVAKSPTRKHYTKDGKEWTGKTHKMPDGNLMTEDPHSEKSVRLYHNDELPSSKRRSAFTR